MKGPIYSVATDEVSLPETHLFRISVVAFSVCVVLSALDSAYRGRGSSCGRSHWAPPVINADGSRCPGKEFIDSKGYYLFLPAPGAAL